MTGVRFYRRLLLVLLVLAVACFLVPLGMRVAVAPFVYESLDDVPRAEVAIVLGASVVAGKPSPILADRANAAIALHSAGKVGKILVTGDNGTLTYNEVAPVRQYLLDAGIPAQDIFLDHAASRAYRVRRYRRGRHTLSVQLRARDTRLTQSALRSMDTSGAQILGADLSAHREWRSHVVLIK